MGKFFSDPVELALKYIYCDVTSGKGQEAFALLQKASEEGDGDASALLARCLSGPQYVWRYHRFPEDDATAMKLVRKAVSQGSALGVLLAMRCGALTPSVEKSMPFSSLREAWDIVYEKAQGGEPFCQFVIGNSYFWWDFLRIEGKGPDDFPNKAALDQFIRENVAKCEYWFLQAFEHGIFLSGNNLRSFYSKGEEGLIPPQPEKEAPVVRRGAELGYPPFEESYAALLRKEGNNDSLLWSKRAAEHGELSSWFDVGLAYEQEKEGARKDFAYAAACYEKGLQDPDDVGCHNRLGAFYYDGDGVPQDYARAYQLLKYAYDHKSAWGVCYLGKCCFFGRGTRQDFAAARQYLEQVDWNNKEAFYCLGVIYGQGLGGVAEDIPKAVAYLQKAGDLPAAREELLKYKKTLFGGKWVRRK